MADFQRQLQQYADLIITVGANVQPGQTLLLQINVEQAFIKICSQ
ncbi:aminopeptidase [Loigolactobacillus jiayinensis]|uniref:Aminopeptidase n=1 Tax=Loigolactobacillus jiayinensis TaxID=2486016 RepID=A0ABW1RBZ8_9LACO|nr:aminopeptidase [Loigolactobacillus jiayinensis]